MLWRQIHNGGVDDNLWAPWKQRSAGSNEDLVTYLTNFIISNRLFVYLKSQQEGLLVISRTTT